MSLTGTIPVLFQGDFALMDPFFHLFFEMTLKCIASFLHEFVDTLRKKRAHPRMCVGVFCREDLRHPSVRVAGGELPPICTHLLRHPQPWDDAAQRELCLHGQCGDLSLSGWVESCEWTQYLTHYPKYNNDINSRRWLNALLLRQGECSLVSLLQVMSAVFGEAPPVCMKPQPEPQQIPCKWQSHSHNWTQPQNKNALGLARER